MPSGSACPLPLSGRRLPSLRMAGVEESDGPPTLCRRGVLASLAGTALLGGPMGGKADDAIVAEGQQLASFEDPLGMFRVSLPPKWYKVRPKDKGDLPDARGKGRRGSRIFSAGDLSNQFAPKILSVERLPVATLLGDAGVILKPEDGPVASAWTEVGRPQAVAGLLVNRRDDESTAMGKGMVSRLVEDSVKIEEGFLTFVTVTDIPVSRPEILEEETGKREIRRYSIYRGFLRPNELEATTKPEPGSGVPIITGVWVSVE
eukprot:CAMPEP_0118981064 /NCGR_PEP_ID=MMETSP1173-20130426/29758_1 /TAXON_ID=1034831 /ORGANISM="Rhizochromulina marina cf, Strain CCMP1243" /LENGTH=260 /DNA_ID=CAMNT_0006931459 /DNA_START=68 /DNA_END=847 /DNA_ORIENTATION=-